MSTTRTPRKTQPRIINDDSSLLSLETDVLIIGGGPAATWAAVSALDEENVSVTLVDKGYCGASGVAATSGTGHWVTPPGSSERRATFEIKDATGGRLSEWSWVDALLNETWTQINKLPGWGWNKIERLRSGPPTINLSLTRPKTLGVFGDHPFFRGPAPDYLRFMRGQVKRHGGLILDHSPAIELLIDPDDGRVAGARGYQRQTRREWSIRARSVVLATGGTTWKSHSQGGDVNTGDGQLMAVEAGAHLAAMEYSNFHGMVPFGTSMDKNGYFVKASYWTSDGTPIDYVDLHKSRVPLLEKSAKGTVFAQFTQFRENQRSGVRANMPNFFAVTDKLGIDPFTQRFPIDWVHEGTVRGTGGIQLADRTCAAGLPGVFVAGDVAARDRVTGASTGAGGPNLSWAVASGAWSGRSAAQFAVETVPSARAVPNGSLATGTSTRTQRIATPSTPQWESLTRRIQQQMLPLENAIFRTEQRLQSMTDSLEQIWDDISSIVPRSPAEEARYREVAGMTAMARWSTASALHRRETRGMHYRVDFPEQSSKYDNRTLTGGLDSVWIRTEEVNRTPVDPPLGPTRGSAEPPVLASSTREGTSA